MALNINNKYYLSIIIFIIPIIVFSSIILSVKIKTSNLESIISSPKHKNISSLCYNLTFSFISEQKSDERYLSLHSYLKSFTPVCIVIIITYFIKIIFSYFCGMSFIEDMSDGYNGMYCFYIGGPGRILTFIPSIVCVIILMIRSSTKNCELFMYYYDLCSPIYGDDFKNNFSNIMNIKIYTLLILILFFVEIVYHAIIFLKIMGQYHY